MKSTIISVGILLVLIVAIIVGGKFTEENPQKIKFGYSIQEAIGDSPLIIAQEKGFFGEAGLTVEMFPLKNGGEIVQALASGSLDLGAVGMTNLLVPISKKAPVKAIAPLALFPVDFFTRPGEIKTFKDLIGKRIASRPGGNADFAVKYFLKKEGINEAEIKFIDIDRAFRPIALMERDIIDAAAAVSYDTTAFTRSGAVLMEEWESKGYSDVISPEFSVAMNIAVNTNYLKDNESLVEKFLTAYTEGHKFILEHKNEAALIVADHVVQKSNGSFTYTADDVLGLWNKQKDMYHLWYEPESLVGLFNSAKEMSIIEYIPNVDEFYDQRFKDLLIVKHQQLYE